VPAGVSDAPVQKGFSAMNFRILAGLARPRAQVLAQVAMIALSAGLLAPEASAQQPAPKAKAAPKAAPGAPAPQAAPPAANGQAQEQPVQLIYSTWTKFCVKPTDPPNSKQICFTGKEGRIESGQSVIAAVIIEPEGEQKKLMRVTLPLGMLLVHGTRMIVDNNAPQQSPFGICLANGCIAEYEATPELLANMKKGQNLYVQAIAANNSPLTLSLPLSEFAKAYDGPPTDPKEIEERQKKLQEELLKRAEEARKKLEATQAGASSAAK
jgi:invasion protein IalB